MILVFLIIGLFIFFPILTMPILFLMAILDKKFRKLYLFMIALGLGFIAFNWYPTRGYDLYRWHLEIYDLTNHNIGYLFQTIIANGEPINYGIKYFIAQLWNVKLLELLVPTIGYYIIFWIIQDNVKNNNYPNSIFVLDMLLITSSLLFLNFVSGIFFFFGCIIFALGIYLYYKEKKKKGLFCLIISCLIHIGLLFPLLIFAYYKIFNNRKKMFVILIITIFLIPNLILPFIIKYFNFGFLNVISEMYNGYFLSTTYNSLHIGIPFIQNLFQILFIISIYIFGKKYVDKAGKFSILLIISLLLMYSYAHIFIRYVFLANMLFLNSFNNFLTLSKKRLILIKRNIIVYGLIIASISFSTIYQIHLLNSINIKYIIYDNIDSSIIKIFYKE